MTRASLLRFSIIFLWIAVAVASFFILRDIHIAPHNIPRVIHHLAVHAGWWGIGIVLAAYVLAVAIPLPTLSLALVAGTAFGPVIGTLVAFVGYNISTTLGYFLGKIIGAKFVQDHEQVWMKRYHDKLKQEGFLTVFFLRLFFFPSEFVNIACGMTDVDFRQFAIGSFLGSLPWILSFSLLGDSLRNPRTLALFAVVLLSSVFFAVLIRRARWVRGRLSKYSLEQQQNKI